MEITRLYQAVVRKLWLIILFSFTGGALAGLVSIFFSVPVYQAETTLYIMTPYKTNFQTGETSIKYDEFAFNRQLLANYSQVISSRKVTSAVIKDLKIPQLTEDYLTRVVSVVQKKDSSVMGIRVIGRDPAMTAAIANATSRAFISQIRGITNNDSVGILDEAQTPVQPMPSGRSKNILVGIMAGAAIAFAIIYIKELFDTTIRSAEDVEKGLGLKIVGIIPEHDIH